MSGELQTEGSEFERRSRALLLESAENLPGAVRSRLTQARYAALAARRSHLPYLARTWAPAGAVAAVVMALLVLGPNGSAPPVSAVSNAALEEDIGLLTDSDAVPLNGDQDMDYDFYEWAAGEAANGVGVAPSVGT